VEEPPYVPFRGDVVDQFIQTLVVVVLVVLPDNDRETNLLRDASKSYKYALPKLSH
jgi:hypothetical protein